MTDQHADERRQTRQFTRRGALLMLAQAAVFGGLGARLYQLQVIEGAATSALAEYNRTRRLLVAPRRGRILDADGTILADTTETFRAVMQARGRLDESVLRAELRRLGPILNLSLAEQERLLLLMGKYGHVRPLTLAAGLSFEQVAALQVRAFEFPYVRTETGSARTYAVAPSATRAAMAHIVGTVGAVDDFQLGDYPLLHLSEVRVGRTGVEAGLEAELRGVAGETVVEVDARGRPIRPVRQTPARAGRDVELSVACTLQARVMERLAEEQGAGAVVALDVRTGQVKAMASLPTYDPASLYGPASPSAWRMLARDVERPLVNRAIAGVYPPGSTFKLVTALSALKAGAITPKEKIECWGDATYAGHVFRCWNRKGHRVSDLHKALRESCDCYFYEAARRTGMDAIAATARELGLGQTYGAGIARQKAGIIPSSAWKRGQGRAGWVIGETLLAGIGQGFVLTTPLQLAVMAARVASGLAVSPTLVKAANRQDFQPLTLAADALAAVRAGMVAVVNEDGGTGQAASLDEPRIVVAGKTGTSQVCQLSADRDLKRGLAFGARDHAVFVGYAPANAPRYAIAVLLEHAGGGGAKAAPVARDCLRMLFEADGTLAQTDTARGSADAAKRQPG